MSLVTRCTACGTLFKVVADQLKISDGWVRCGQCATVFDAQNNLVTEPPSMATKPAAGLGATPQTAPRASSNSLPPDSSPEQAIWEQQATAPAAFSGFSSGFFESVPETAASSQQPAQLGRLTSDARATDQRIEPPDSSADAKSASELESPSFQPGALRNSSDLDSESGPSTASWTASEYPIQHTHHLRDQHDPRSISVSAEPTTINTPPHSDSISSQSLSTLPQLDSSHPSTTPSFVIQAQRAQRWRSPWMRLALCSAGLLLLAGLTVQVSIHDKDRIAAQWPQSKPWLSQLCQHAGCQVQALKRIEAITVDASSFNRINKNNAAIEAPTQSYKLALTLKNTAALPVALPHVELSLQDAQDQPILRRVLSPADLGTGLQALAPAQDLAGSLTLQIDTAQLAGNRISGYRVLAFYP
jgi:predicted Zn finger-like uncharacterized protein